MLDKTRVLIQDRMIAIWFFSLVLSPQNDCLLTAKAVEA